MTTDRDSLTQLHAIADILLDVERTLRRHQLWHDEIPAPAAMASRTPFCADTLSFTQWLQFVFLPRMRRIVEHAEPLPTASGIAVMAREALPDAPVATD